MSAYCDDDITATEPFSQYAASATPAQLVDLLFAHCHPEQILGVWKLLRECFDPASADPGAACLFEPLAPKPPALHLVRRELEAIALAFIPFGFSRIIGLGFIGDQSRGSLALKQGWCAKRRSGVFRPIVLTQVFFAECVICRSITSDRCLTDIERLGDLAVRQLLLGKQDRQLLALQAVLAGRLSSVLGALAADFEREIL
jgi:hypothetical protein